jgi:hypothetical protein
MTMISACWSFRVTCHDHMCVMVVSSAYLGFSSLGLEESGSSSRTHPHVVSGDIV